MAEKIKEQKGIAFLTILGLIFLTIGTLGTFEVMVAPVSVSAESAASSTVNVSATVSAYISIGVDNTTPDLGALISSLGVLDSGSSTLSATVSTNDGNGYTLSIQGIRAGLASSTDIDNFAYTADATLFIASVASPGSTTIAVGADYYGATASSTHSAVHSNYAGYDTLEIGAIPSSTSPIIADEASANANRVTQVMILATCDGAQLAGTYTDRIWLTATGQTP